MIDLQEYLVADNVTLVAVEPVPEMVEIGVQGVPGPAYSGGPIDMHDAPLYHARIVGFTQEVDNGVFTDTGTIQLIAGQKQCVVLAGNTGITFDNDGAPCGNYQVRLIQDGTGGRLPSFLNLDPARWLGTFDQPPVNDAPNGESLLSLYWDGSQFIQSLTKVGAI